MRIGIDARFYGPRFGGGGIGRYVAELVTHLQQIDRENEYVLFLRKENFHECVIKNANFVKRMVDVPWYSVAEQRVMPKEVALSRVRVMHYPHWNVPVLSRTPFVVTIHDLIMLEDPHSSRASTRNAFVHGVKHMGMRMVIDAAVHRSKYVIAVSEYTRQQILGRFRVNAHKVKTVYNGVSQPLAVDGKVVTEAGIRTPYFFYVGNAYPHKNLETLIDAFREVSAVHPEATLVLAGRRDVFVDRLARQADGLGIRKGAIRFVHLPTDAEVAALYAHASLFIYPSRIEGFGIPPLEAMSYGTLLAVSSAASIPEIVGDAGRYFDPSDGVALARLMLDALERPESYVESRKAAPYRLAQFSWKKTAQQTREIYLRTGIRRV